MSDTCIFLVALVLGGKMKKREKEIFCIVIRF